VVLVAAHWLSLNCQEGEDSPALKTTECARREKLLERGMGSFLQQMSLTDRPQIGKITDETSERYRWYMQVICETLGLSWGSTRSGGTHGERERSMCCRPF